MRLANNLGHHAIQLAEGRLQLAGQGCPRRCQGNAAPGLFNQFLANDFCQFPQLVADRAGGYANFFRGRTDGTKARHRFEIMKAAQQAGVIAGGLTLLYLLCLSEVS